MVEIELNRRKKSLANPCFVCPHTIRSLCGPFFFHYWIINKSLDPIPSAQLNIRISICVLYARSPWTRTKRYYVRTAHTYRYLILLAFPSKVMPQKNVYTSKHRSQLVNWFAFCIEAKRNPSYVRCLCLMKRRCIYMHAYIVWKMECMRARCIRTKCFTWLYIWYRNNSLKI